MEFDAVSVQNASQTCLAGPIPASRIYDQYNSYTFNPIPNPYDDPSDALAEVEAPLEPAIRWDGKVMVVGNMGQEAGNARWPLVFYNPVDACPNSPQVPATVMNDLQSLAGFSSAFDAVGNLFLSDTNRNRVLAYWQPFPSMVPTSICVNTLTITPTITLKVLPIQDLDYDL